MKTTTTRPKIVTPQDGQAGFLGSIGVRFMIDGVDTDQGFALVEIIAPAGFENFFKELDALGGAINMDPDELTELAARYGHSFRLESVPELLERFDLRVGEPLRGGWVPR